MTPPPQYVDHGGMQSYPPPSVFSDVTARGFVLAADRAKLQALIDRMLNEPCGGALHYVVPVEHVLLTFVDVQVGRFEQYPDAGFGTEHECDIWIPIMRVKTEAGVQVVEQIAFFLPYLFVDNSAAIITGREVYGFQKQWGWIDMPSGADAVGPMTAEVQGAKVAAKSSHIERTLLLTMKPEAAGPAEVAGTWATFDDAVLALRDAMGIGDAISLPGLSLTKELLDLLLKQEMPLVFLKQFRDIAANRAVCYQAITQAPAKITGFSGVHLAQPHDLVLEDLATHPISAELGVDNQRAGLSFIVQMTFSALAGEVLWQADVA